MSASAEDQPREQDACAACQRRSWLLSQLGGPLDYAARDRARLLKLLALEDSELLAALAGRRAGELRDAYEQLAPDRLPRESGVQRICRHRSGYPGSLASPMAPRMLTVRGGAARLQKLTRAPVVALLGSRAPSDYGRAMARSLARGLAASGVTLAAGLGDGIALAAHEGALEAGGRCVVVLSGGLDVACPARRRALLKRILQRGCAVSELPVGCSGRRWGERACERIVVELAQLSVVVEAEQTKADLSGAQIACALGRPLAAVPGRVTSPLSRGAHALLLEGASLVRGPRDVLELLSDCASEAEERHEAQPAPSGIPARDGLRAALWQVFKRVGAGADTPDRLLLAGVDSRQVLSALGELELVGLLVRGDGGRYLPRDALD